MIGNRHLLCTLCESQRARIITQLRADTASRPTRVHAEDAGLCRASTLLQDVGASGYATHSPEVVLCHARSRKSCVHLGGWYV